MDARRRLGLTRLRDQDLAAQRARLETVPIEERLLEVIAWSSVLLADELRRAPSPVGRRERPVPPGLGAQLRS